MNEKVSYEEIDTLVMLHQDGASDATEQLIINYDGYFQKFLNVLHHNRFRVSDSTQRRFVSSFLSDEGIRNNVNRYMFDGYISNTLSKVAYNLRTKLSHLDEMELKNEMVCIFLNLASNHNGSASFASYVSYYFPLRLNTKVTRWIKDNDSIVRHEIPYDEEMIEAAHYDETDFDEENDFYYIEPMDSTDFDENWVNGNTCGDLFQGLTTYERRLIKWYYEWRTFDYTTLPPDLAREMKQRFKHTEQEIADLLGCSRKTVNLKRNDVKRRIQELAEDIHVIKR